MEDRAGATFAMFGGTFNPIHQGHLGLIRGLSGREELSRLFVIPAARNPFKNEGDLLPARLRHEMVCSAVEGLPKITVLDWEIKQDHPSYTIETITSLSGKYPLANLKLVIGWDVFLEFKQWRQAADILKKAGLWVVMRSPPGTDPSQMQEGLLPGLPGDYREKAHLGDAGEVLAPDGRILAEWINLELPDIPSTQIRAERDLSMVPEGAREILSSYWNNQESEA